MLTLNPFFLRRYALFGLGMTLSAVATAAAPIFVLNSRDANVSIIDPVTYTELRRVPTGKEPHHLYLTPDEKSLMVANAMGDSITFINPQTGEVQRTLTNIVDPYQLRVSPDMKWFVTAANRRHSTTAYVSLQDTNELIAIDLPSQAPLWTIPVGKTPADVFIRPDDKVLFVALTGDSYVEAYDLTVSPARLITRLKTGAGAHAFRAQGDRRYLFVSNRTANTVSRIDMDTLTVLATYPVAGGPDCMDMLADGKTLLITSRWSRQLSVLDLDKETVARRVSVGKSPHGVWTLDHAGSL